METTKNKRTSIKVLQQESHLLTWIDAFLLSRKAENKSKATIEFYHDKLKKFTTWCDVQIITQIDQLTRSLFGITCYIWFQPDTSRAAYMRTSERYVPSCIGGE